MINDGESTKKWQGLGMNFKTIATVFSFCCYSLDITYLCAFGYAHMVFIYKLYLILD